MLLPAALAAGCATHGHYAAPVRDVGWTEFGKYWVMDPHSMASDAAGPPPGSGCFRAEVTIDSDGKIWDPRVLALSGPDSLKAWAPKFAMGLRYLPSAANTAHVPIRTMQQWSFDRDAETFQLTPEQMAKLTPDQQEAMKSHKPFQLSSEQIAEFQADGQAKAAQAAKEFTAKCEAELDRQYPLR